MSTNNTKTMFYIEFSKTATIRLAADFDEAMEIAEREARKHELGEVEDVRLATDEDKNWLVSMGGTLPVEPTPTFAPYKKTIEPLLEMCLHFARLAEVAAIAGVHVESVQHAIAHICSTLDDMSGTPEAENHAAELSALYEYAENALNAAHNHPECHEEVCLMVSMLETVKSRVSEFNAVI